MSENVIPPGSKKPKVEVTDEDLPHAENSNWFSTVTVDRMIEHVQSVSQREVVELVFEHTIHELSLLPQKNGESYLTKVFYARSHPSIKWKLEIFPKGSSLDDKDWVSIFLVPVMKKIDPPVVAVFKIILQRDGNEILSQLCEPPHQYTFKTAPFGIPNLIKQDQILGGNSSSLKIICHLVCEVSQKDLLFTKTLENAYSTFHQSVMELNFEWIIKELDFLPQKNGESFSSPVFSAKVNNKIRWRIQIYPKGRTEESDYFGLFLERVVENDDPLVIVKCKIGSIFRNDKKVALALVCFEKEMGLAPLPKIWGWPKLLALGGIQRDQQHNGPDELKINIQLVYTI